MYQEKLKATYKPTIRIKLDAQVADQPWNSKVGGVPYLPTGMAYPVDANGEKLQFLAQINFEEIPALEGYPTQGILAFYIGSDDLCGLDFDDPMNQDGFKVIYFENITHDVNITAPTYAEESPIQSESSMLFELINQHITTSDFHCERILGEEDYEKFVEQEYENEDEGGHLLGGYPFFTQGDPRQYNEKIKDYVLLFQLDSDDDHAICWGDVGVANFFIHPNDLKNRDFSCVAYTWDCS
ncbi:YwqG family protein [Acinetobacter sp. HY1485]|uniref:YwqG family protein n=1 Tax=Acinetobacter sp. HY1485 TaxID=2970918 RepID=UPI0022B9B26E|nr:YwqG family protein [Acinetobacter sp. HY1485]